MQEIEHPEENIQAFIVNILAQLINVLHLLIPVVVKFSKEYPTAFVAVSTIIALYILYRMVMNLYTMIKRLMYLAILLVIIGAYMRGEAFFEQDLPKIGNYLWENRETIITTVTTTLQYVAAIVQRQVVVIYFYLRKNLEAALQ